VGLDCSLADVEPFGDRFVGEAFGY